MQRFKSLTVFFQIEQKSESNIAQTSQHVATKMQYADEQSKTDPNSDQIIYCVLSQYEVQMIT